MLSSVAGGSGSVIAPLMVSELLGMQVPVIAIGVGSADTRLDAENSLKTIKSYQAISQMRNAPVVMAYMQNGVTFHRDHVDGNVETVIMALCALFSRKNKELDSRDLYNWLRYEKVTTFEPELVSLTVVEGSPEISGLGNVISVATLSTKGIDTNLSEMTDVQYTGYLPESAHDILKGQVPIHFVTSDGVFPEVVKQLQKVLSDRLQSQNARIRKDSILTNADQPTHSGLVL